MASQVFQWRCRTLYTCPNPPEPIFSQLPNSLSSKVFSSPMAHGEPLSRAIPLLLGSRPPARHRGAQRSAAPPTPPAQVSQVCPGWRHFLGRAGPGRARRRPGELRATRAVRGWLWPGRRYPGPAPSGAQVVLSWARPLLLPAPPKGSAPTLAWGLQRPLFSPGSPQAPAAGERGSVAAAPGRAAGCTSRVSNAPRAKAMGQDGRSAHCWAVTIKLLNTRAREAPATAFLPFLIRRAWSSIPSRSASLRQRTTNPSSVHPAWVCETRVTLLCVTGVLWNSSF